MCVIRHDRVCAGEKYGEMIIQCSPAVQGVSLSVYPSVRSLFHFLSAAQMRNSRSCMFLQSQEGGAGFADTNA